VPGYNATRSHNTSHLNYQHTTKGNTVTKVETVVLPIPQGVNFRLKVLMSLIKVQILTKSELTLFANAVTLAEASRHQLRFLLWSVKWYANSTFCYKPDNLFHGLHAF